MRRIFIAVLFVFVLSIGCANMNKAQQGAGLGALSGALVGHIAGEDAEAALIGAGIGGTLGYMVGNEMDKYDRRQINKTLESTPDKRSTNWENPNTGNRYKATPLETNTSGSRPTREIKIKADTDGDGRFDETTYADARRKPNGKWKIVSD